MLINVKMPTIVGILTFISKISCSVELSMEKILQPRGLVVRITNSEDADQKESLKRAVGSGSALFVYQAFCQALMIKIKGN